MMLRDSLHRLGVWLLRRVGLRPESMMQQRGCHVSTQELRRLCPVSQQWCSSLPPPSTNKPTSAADKAQPRHTDLFELGELSEL